MSLSVTEICLAGMVVALLLAVVFLWRRGRPGGADEALLRSQLELSGRLKQLAEQSALEQDKIARAIGDNADKKQSVCPGFAARTQKFFADQIWRHSFTDEEILRLQNTLGRRLPNPRIEEILRAAARETGLVHKQKRNRDMRSLNRWAMAFNSDDLLKKLSFRNTYINVAYARLVRQTDTKDLNPEELYRRHRLDVQKQVRDLTGTRDAKGKEICRKYAVNKVYKAIAGQDKFKLQCVQHALAKYRDEAFCRETAAILAALDGGDKNRNVLLPADFAKSQNGGGR